MLPVIDDFVDSMVRTLKDSADIEYYTVLKECTSQETLPLNYFISFAISPKEPIYFAE